MGAARRIVGGLGALLLLLSAALFWMDTGPGHRFVAAQIAHLEPRNGLRIQLTRIDGSLYGKAQLVGLRLSDLDGVFFEAPRVDLDWSPSAWGVNRLDIRRLSASTARLHRLPRLRPSPPGKPMLPSFDVRIGALVLDRLDIGKGVSGQPQRGRLTGAATLRLPAVATSEGREVRVKTGSNLSNQRTLTLTPATADTTVTIDGSASATMDRDYDGITVHCIGRQWYITHRKSK